VAPFINKSVSEQTRRAYGRAVREFFQSRAYPVRGESVVLYEVSELSLILSDKRALKISTKKFS
jgi:hypothetical protein